MRQRRAGPVAALGFSDAQADQFAEALAAQPGVASAFAAMPLVDLLKLVPPGALTKDVFRIGHEPGWFFDRFYATGVAAEGGGSPETGSAETAETAESPPHAVALRSGFEFALPLAGYATARDRADEQDRAARNQPTEQRPGTTCGRAVACPTQTMPLG